MHEVVWGEFKEWVETYDIVLRTGKPIRFERENIHHFESIEVNYSLLGLAIYSV